MDQNTAEMLHCSAARAVADMTAAHDAAVIAAHRAQDALVTAKLALRAVEEAIEVDRVEAWQAAHGSSPLARGEVKA